MLNLNQNYNSYHGKLRMYQPLHIQYCCRWNNMPLGSNRTGWKFLSESLLKPLNMIFQKPVHCGDTHQFIRFNFCKSFNVNRPPLFVYTMVTMRIIMLNFFVFIKYKFLKMGIKLWHLLKSLKLSKKYHYRKIIIWHTFIQKTIAFKCCKHSKCSIFNCFYWKSTRSKAMNVERAEYQNNI